MSEKFYQIGAHTESDWDSLNAELISEGCLCEHVPDRCVACADDKPHSPTRGTYLLTDQEAELLKNDPRVKFINIDYSQYPKIYKAPADELQSTSPELVQRYTGTVKNYRRVVTLPNPTTSADVNRTGYQLLRCQQKLDPWVDQNLVANAVVESNISLYGSGKNIDVIVGDDGMWFGHPEFQNNTVIQGTSTPTQNPRDYVGGNVLPGNGTCDLLDLVLDAPYYLDPAWFNASPGTRLITRWDGTIVPVESVARTWWGNASQRSAQFASAGIISITSAYTRNFNNGSNFRISDVGQHGTPCCALTYGRTQGWAYNANKWALNVYNTNGSDIEQYFDLMKLFHQLKPTNPTYGNKNPTISSNSWGYRASKGTTNGYYHFRGVATQYGGVNSEPAFISHLGQTGDSGRWKSEMKTNSYTTALDECIASGVIFVAASGNSNQKQVGSSHPDWENRVSATAGQTMAQTSYFEFGLETTGSTNRRGFPQQAGMFDDGGTRVYPAINIGALNDDFKGTKESKVNYSDRGEEIDVYAPADGTLAANHTYSSVGNRPETYSQYGVAGGAITDNGFSAVCSSSNILTGGNFVPESGDSFSIVTSSGAATITAITPNLTSITTNPATIPTSGNADDGYYTVNLPWNVTFNGSSYNTVYVGTNTYITFGGGSAVYNAISSSNPPFNKICLSSADNSTQRIYSGIENTFSTSVTASGTVGSAYNGSSFVVPAFAESIADTDVVNGYLGQSWLGAKVTGAGITGNWFINFVGTNSGVYGVTGSGVFNPLVGTSVTVAKVEQNARKFIIRVQSTNSTSGTLGSPNMEFEYHFFENSATRIDLHVNLNAQLSLPTVTAPTFATDCTFGGTSAACPVATGLIATILEHNRSWGWQEVRTWLETLDTQADGVFYFGTESTTATSSNWFDYESLEGSPARVLYQGAVNLPPPTPVRRGVLQGGMRMNGNLRLKFR